MTLLDRILRDSYDLRHEEARRTGTFPKTVCYLGWNQRRELMSDFNAMRFTVARKPDEPWSGDTRIGDCTVIYVTQADHYNVTLLRE
jgi:hypothetical protein